MKKSSLLIAALFLAICFSSCEKEEIEIVNQTQSIGNTSTLRSSAEDDSSADCGGVTDPNDDTDINMDMKNPIPGEN